MCECEWMNHTFNKKSETAFSKFLKTAQAETSNPFCDKSKYELWKNFMKVDDALLVLESGEKDEIIDLVDSDSEETNINVSVEPTNVTVEALQTSTCEDITASLKEYLESADQIPIQLFMEMENCSSQIIHGIFNRLSGQLNTEQILLIGESIENSTLVSDSILRYYCECVLIRKMRSVFEEDIKLVFLRFCDRYHQIIIPLIVTSINENDDSDIFLLYLMSIQTELREEVLRELLKFQCFPKKYILVVDCLVHEDLQSDCLEQLLKVMAHNTEEYVTDKEYGKLLIKVVQYLGTNLTKHKSPLKHILANHKSIWKTKLQKIFNSSFEESLLCFESQVLKEL